MSKPFLYRITIYFNHWEHLILSLHLYRSLFVVGERDMAWSANVLLQNKTLALLNFPFVKLQDHKFIGKLPLPFPSKHLQSYERTCTSVSANTKAASNFQLREKIQNSISSNWREFARNVSGEWDGYGAEFTREGKPIELPECVVPEAFREWEVKVFDWQTQCPTLAQPEEQILAYKSIKLLPTVGCEADAATQYSIDERNINKKVYAFAFHSSGCYVAIWVLEDHGDFRLLELENCLVDPQNRESRVRVTQVVCVGKDMFSLQSIKVFCERWYGPFRNGEQLGGCAIQDSAFAATEALKASDVIGAWQGTNYVASFQSSQTSILQEIVDEKPRKTVINENGLILLPKQLWCSIRESEDDEYCGEVGWLLDPECAFTSRCTFSKDGYLKEISIGHENVV